METLRLHDFAQRPRHVARRGLVQHGLQRSRVHILTTSQVIQNTREAADVAVHEGVSLGFASRVRRNHAGYILWCWQIEVFAACVDLQVFSTAKGFRHRLKLVGGQFSRAACERRIDAHQGAHRIGTANVKGIGRRSPTKVGHACLRNPGAGPLRVRPVGHNLL